MERRMGRIIVSAAGGTASLGSKTYKVSIPSSWIKEMRLDENNRDISLAFDGKRICIEPQMSTEKFVAEKKIRKHDIRKISFYDGDMLCSEIYADFTDETLKVKNFTFDVVKTAFGNNVFPTWSDFTDFLKERCIPNERSGLREYLEIIGIEEYNPIEIIKKTAGRMAEDNQWIKLEEIK